MHRCPSLVKASIFPLFAFQWRMPDAIINQRSAGHSSGRREKKIAAAVRADQAKHAAVTDRSDTLGDQRARSIKHTSSQKGCCALTDDVCCQPEADLIGRPRAPALSTP